MYASRPPLSAAQQQAVADRVASGDMTCVDDTYSQQMERFVGDDRFHDIVFRFAEGTDCVFAHKVILAARSPVMQQALMVNGEWHDMPEVVLDEGVEPAVFKFLLRYMYTSKADVPYEHLHSMLLLSHRFQVQGLVDACQSHLTQSLTTDNLLMNLEVAEICGLGGLRSKCAEKLQQPGLLPRLLDDDNLRKVALPGIRALLALDPLPVGELKLFLAALRWAATQVGEELGEQPRPVSREVAELVAPLMEQIRFPTMTGRELRTIVKPYNVVDPARYVEALEHLADVDSEGEAARNAAPNIPRFRSRHPVPEPAHQTPRRRIERLTTELSRLTTASPGGLPPADYSASPLRADAYRGGQGLYAHTGMPQQSASPSYLPGPSPPQQWQPGMSDRGASPSNLR